MSDNAQLIPVILTTVGPTRQNRWSHQAWYCIKCGAYARKLAGLRHKKHCVVRGTFVPANQIEEVLDAASLS